jgi:hypothetical protein
MSAYTAIRAASLTLQKVLQDAINIEFPPTPPNVSRYIRELRSLQQQLGTSFGRVKASRSFNSSSQTRHLTSQPAANLTNSKGS